MGPMASGERYAIIDIVRGFALFGVLLSNVLLTTQFLALPDSVREALPTATWDTAVLFIADTLVTDKFYTLFSMLFGLGFAVQLHRAHQRGADIGPVYVRRLIVLFGLGALHGSLLWFGDVLHIYAILGFVLLFFARRSDRFVLACAVGVAAIGGAIPVLDWLAETRGWTYPLLFGADVPVEDMYQIVAHGTYGQVLELNWRVHLLDYGRPGFSGWIGTWYLDILWRFLLGFLVGRGMLRAKGRISSDSLRRLMVWTLSIGLAGNAAMSARLNYGVWPIDNGLVSALVRAMQEIWVLALAVGYVALLTLLYQRPTWDRLLGGLAPVGRMALTNYVAQSAAMMALFYGAGLGLLGHAGATACLALSVLVFAGQIAFSRWWLDRYRFGPLEWLWRSLTYRRLQPLRLERLTGRGAPV
jgi:uncharacterized protein